MNWEDWKRGAGYGALGLYTTVAGGQAFVEGKEVLAQLCFTAADCQVKQDLPAHGFGGSPLGPKPQVIATSTNTAMPSMAGDGPLSWLPRSS